MSESDNDKAWREAAMTMPTYEHEITAYLGCSFQEVEKAKVRCIWDVGDWMQTEDACREIAKLRKALGEMAHMAKQDRKILAEIFGRLPVNRALDKALDEADAMLAERGRGRGDG